MRNDVKKSTKTINKTFIKNYPFFYYPKTDCHLKGTSFTDLCQYGRSGSKLITTNGRTGNDIVPTSHTGNTNVDDQVANSIEIRNSGKPNNRCTR